MSSTVTTSSPRRRPLLTDTIVRNAKPQQKPVKLPDAGGLFLLLQPNGTKLWRYRFWLHNKEGLMALGKYPDITLAVARERHSAARKLVADGINPVHAQQEAKLRATQQEQRRTMGTFAAVCDSWRALTDPELKPASIRQREREIENDLMPTFGARAIGSITRLEITAALEKVKARAPETARNLRTHLSAIFEHAIDKGLITANPTPPRSIMGKRRQVSHAAMPEDQIGLFLCALDKAHIEPATRIAMLLVLLTVGRKEEIIGARWSEFDFENALWLIPGERMKAGRDHLVPISRQAMTLLRELRAIVPAEREHLFPNRRDPTRQMANRSLNAVLERLGFNNEATIHGWRAVFSTHYNAQERNPDVIERCLAHAPGNETRAAYNRAHYLAQRRALLQEWADFLDMERAMGTGRCVQSID